MNLDLDTINRLFLELSQFATATTRRELELLAELKAANDMLRSAHSIAERQGVNTGWPEFQAQLSAVLQSNHRVLHPVREASVSREHVKLALAEVEAELASQGGMALACKANALRDILSLPELVWNDQTEKWEVPA